MSTLVSALPVRITKSVVDRLIAPKAGQAFTRDSKLKGFAVRITTSGAKSFILEKRIDGKVKRLTLGRYPELTVGKEAKGTASHNTTKSLR
ncbi:Arm DNA-binding domain-containing protein [Nitrosospira sp. NpAV]|uniref:Arm DNA-binding domain-containing protein n=1 Tax=Nitrosospira sp. NpAV TaxID=58133 RepID=UPI001E5D4843|nr:Arm DNA-binding domain-containing protein [Nitrosospira sp. NpAV]